MPENILQFQQPPTINIAFHIAVFLVSAIAFIISAGLWYNRKINNLKTSPYWHTFVMGIFFYSIAEFIDIFTPGLHASLGVHNLITEMTLLAGLSLIFISLYRFLQDYIRERISAPQTKSSDTQSQNNSTIETNLS